MTMPAESQDVVELARTACRQGGERGLADFGEAARQFELELGQLAAEVMDGAAWDQVDSVAVLSRLSRLQEAAGRLLKQTGEAWRLVGAQAAVAELLRGLEPDG